MGIRELHSYAVVCDRCGCGEVIHQTGYPYTLANGWTVAWVESGAEVRCPVCAAQEEAGEDARDGDGQS